MSKKFHMLGIFTVFVAILLSFQLFGALAQYQTQQTVDVAFSSTGTVHVSQTSTSGDISIELSGAPGATGSVSTATYIGNPQPTASKPDDVALTRFVVVTFNIAPNDFQSADITIHYSDEDVADLISPYFLFKYIPETNSYVQLNAEVDTAAKTITTHVSSPTDPLFAIGGSATQSTAGNYSMIYLAVVIVAGVVLVVSVIVINRRKPRYRILA